MMLDTLTSSTFLWWANRKLCIMNRLLEGYWSLFPGAKDSPNELEDPGQPKRPCKREPLFSLSPFISQLEMQPGSFRSKDASMRIKQFESNSIAPNESTNWPAPCCLPDIVSAVASGTQ